MGVTARPAVTQQQRESAEEILTLLEREYPEMPRMLNYNSEYELLVGVILSASATDAQVNRVTPALFQRFPTVQDMAGCTDANIIEPYIRSVGLGGAKSTNLLACARMLVEQYEGRVPLDRESLLTLPGVGRKTAAVMLCAYTDAGAIAVDTHVTRVTNRLGLVDTENRNKIERELYGILPEKRWCSYSQRANWHGRVYCTSKSPRCRECPVRRLCAYAQTNAAQ